MYPKTQNESCELFIGIFQKVKNSPITIPKTQNESYKLFIKIFRNFKIPQKLYPKTKKKRCNETQQEINKRNIDVKT